jgi:hypothetical protein
MPTTQHSSKETIMCDACNEQFYLDTFEPGDDPMIDAAQFYANALQTARANLTYMEGTARANALRHVAREALQEAHSTLSQPDFFAALDALGGQQAVIEKLVQDLGRFSPEVRTHHEGNTP